MKQEAFKQLEAHLKDAPQELKDYTLKSWNEQAQEGEYGYVWGALTYFTWVHSFEGHQFWSYIHHQEFTEALKLAQENGWINEHPVTLLPLQVMEVSDEEQCWVPRVVFAKTKYWFLSFGNYHSIEEAREDNFLNGVTIWQKARPIEKKLTLSVDEATKMLSELKGIKVEIK
jgi:hypothetical protein